jgi:hypothetical protein
MGGSAAGWRIGDAPTTPPTRIEFDVCLMAAENRAIVGYEAPLKTRLPVLMLALSLITSAVRAKIPQEAPMKLSSPDFSEGENIPERFTCGGKDVSPTLKIDGVPKEAKSLVLMIDDPDAPVGNFTHWLMRNVVPSNRDRGEQTAVRSGAGSERFWKMQIQRPVSVTGHASLLF